MTESQLKLIFKNIYPTCNPLTTIIIEYVQVGRHICELSRSDNDYSGIIGNMYGVTVISKYKGKYMKNNELDKCFHNIQQAYKYIDELNGK